MNIMGSGGSVEARGADAAFPEPGIRDRIAAIISIINSGLYDREDIVKICVLAVLAGQNVFL